MNRLWSWITTAKVDERTELREQDIIDRAKAINDLVDEFQRRRDLKEQKNGLAGQNCNR
jgi:hypothetical protein